MAHNKLKIIFKQKTLYSSKVHFIQPLIRISLLTLGLGLEFYCYHYRWVKGGGVRSGFKGHPLVLSCKQNKIKKYQRNQVFHVIHTTFKLKDLVCFKAAFGPF